jgi:D-glucuronyl C5-epimerase C-terminus
VRRSLLVLLAVAAFPATVSASPVLVLGHDGRARARNDPFVTGPAITPVPATAAPAAVSKGGLTASAARVSHPAKPPPKPKRRPQRTVASELTRMYRSHAITQATYRQDNASFNQALKAEKHLTGTRRTELTSVTETLHQVAASGDLTASRLPALFLTLNRNRQWWTTGSLPASGERIEFSGSPLVWEYYPGQGIQLQVLGTFGEADGLFTAGRAHYGELEKLLAQMIPLAAKRAGGLTWEYYFNFDGGRPPWTSAMSQATGLEALTRAFKATGNGYYLNVARQAMPVFTVAPPAGVAVKTALGTRFLQYTFAPSISIINAFLQTLIGLDDYALESSNPLAARLFASGNAEAMAEVPHFDTGAWSLYQPGVEDDLSYHELVTGFLQQLCTLTSASVYCTTAKHFHAYLTTPPTLRQLTTSGRVRKATTLRFRLSKISRVGIVVTRGTTTTFETSATFPYGVDHFTIPAAKRVGTYGIRLTATDLAGNFTAISGTLKVGKH